MTNLIIAPRALSACVLKRKASKNTQSSILNLKPKKTKKLTLLTILGLLLLGGCQDQSSKVPNTKKEVNPKPIEKVIHEPTQNNQVKNTQTNLAPKRITKLKQQDPASKLAEKETNILDKLKFNDDKEPSEEKPIGKILTERIKFRKAKLDKNSRTIESILYQIQKVHQNMNDEDAAINDFMIFSEEFERLTQTKLNSENHQPLQSTLSKLGFTEDESKALRKTIKLFIKKHGTAYKEWVE